MDVILSTQPFDRIDSPIASFGFFTDMRPLTRAAALVDWRMNGKLSRFIEQERVSGTAGEALFLPTDGRIQAEALLLFGLGSGRRWDASRTDELFLPWIEKLESLKKDTWLLSFSGLAKDFLSWRQAVRSFVNCVAYRSKTACRCLRLSESADWVDETKKRHMDFGEKISLSYESSRA